LRQKHEEEIRDAVTMNTWKRESWRKIITDITDKTGDYARDYGRIAATEKQRAMQEGQSRALTKRFGSPKKVRVAKQPAPDACEHCVALHLTAGRGSVPKIFTLAELTANGTNVGRKARDWRAVVGPVHPWCFVAGTKIECEGRQLVPIEDVRAGTLVRTHLDRLRAVQRLSKRVYRGELIVVTAGNQVLQSTPEHPFLTQRGFVTAGALQSSDCLLHIAATVADTHANEIPGNDLEKIFLLDVLRSLVRRRVPVAGIDFDGNTEIGETEIEAISVSSELWSRFISELQEGIGHEAFGDSKKALCLNALCRFYGLHSGTGLSTYGVVSCFREAQSILRAALACDDDALLAESANSKPVTDKPGSDGTSCDAMGLRDRLHALATFVGVDDPFFVELHVVGHEPAYHGVPVTSIERRPFDGDVYNFSVEEDESYVAGGVVVHNCACELIHVPDGWSFDDEGNLVPESLKRADLLTRNLQKALNYTESAPTDRVHVQIADPFVRAAVERVVAETPPEVFTVGSGVTMITTDIVRTETPLNANDYAYWTANEIRLMQTIPHEKVDRVIRHEIGHSLNVWAVKKLGSVAAVRAWHTRLWKVSQVEGFVSTYARKEPIENAAEATRLYLYDRSRLMLRYPRTFAFLHRMYRDLIRGNHAHPEDRRDPPKA